jgi:hypothetical protein
METSKYGSDSVVVEASASSSIRNIDDKCEGIFLETTNETIVVESSQEEEAVLPGDISSAAVGEDTRDENQHEKSESEPAENLVSMSEPSAAATTPKAVKKKSKTSTPTSRTNKAFRYII